MGPRRGLSLLLTLLLTATSCAGTGTPATQAPVRTDRVEIHDSPGTPESEWGYRPREIRVPAGTAVTFVNTGREFHTVTPDAAPRAFDIAVPAGQTVTHTFDTPGTFPYHCGLHPEMKGVLHVCDGECD